ncbi:SDR family oxidoreductase [Achromobacter aloeverae]|uniref:Short-chain dehydrogenase n=1 Tax=Achromobacter aloeverae TaxID=1750518 RepID=A0A4Q1HL93_9BURK|nr:SDR family oxidoreductase [Achromobacter aloeverae]RXN90268.1 short-chain dehydrogenase [Achromobacter aloeverae]
MLHTRHHPRVVVITGASAGVGRATALAFARHGASVALLARDPQALEDVAEQARRAGVRALPLAVDVSDADAVEDAAARVEAELGPIDVWVNNAMLTTFSPLELIHPADYARITDVTYLGYVYGTMAALRRMRERRRGCIVQVGSALAYRSIPLQSAYCGAKHAIRGFTDAVRCELLHDRVPVHLTMVQMPALNTPQFDWAQCHMAGEPQPVAPIYQPEVAAHAIVWAATHRRREVYVGLSTVQAIVANKFFPGLLDRYLGRVGYRMQQRATRVPPGRPDNLREPVRRLHRSHGSFDAQARPYSRTLWLDTHRGWLAGAGVLAACLWLSKRRR